MRTPLARLVITASILLYGACSSPTNSSQTAGQSTITTTDTSTRPTEATQESQPLKDESVSGQVKHIQRGKDGYTAKIITAHSVVYFVTISVANLKGNDHQYRDVKVGEIIQVRGDSWKIANENHLTVRELK